jgi:hypothetical protein
MIEEIETKLLVELEDIFDGLAKPTLDIQKKKLGLGEDISLEDYKNLIEGIKNACRRLAGEQLAEDAYKKLQKILEDQGGK